MLLLLLVRAADNDGSFTAALACESAFPLVGQCICCMHPVSAACCVWYA
jgi:hypothetical protein